MRNDVELTIVLVTYGRRDYLKRCLDSIHGQENINFEIVVVVNPSGDGTELMLETSFPQIQRIQMHKNIGFFPALNIGIANGCAEYVMVVDDDAYFMQDDALFILLNYLKSNPETDVVSSNIEGPFENTIPDDEVRDINVFKTGFAMMPRKLFSSEIGYYPDAFFRSAGENYLSKKIWDNGKRIQMLGSVKMFHDQASTGRSDADWKFYGIRSQVLCTLMRDPLPVIPILILSKFVKSFFLFVKWGHLFTWGRAWLSIGIHIPYALHLRDPISLQTWRKIRAMEQR